MSDTPNSNPHLDNRHLFRQLVVQELYQRTYSLRASLQVEHQQPDIKETLELDRMGNKLFKKLSGQIEEAVQLAEEILAQTQDTDTLVAKLAPTWPLDQINPVNLQILRLAIYEGFTKKLIPAKVAIDEAIELARDFGGESDIKFVSGVLGSLFSQQ